MTKQISYLTFYIICIDLMICFGYFICIKSRRSNFQLETFRAYLYMIYILTAENIEKKKK